MPRNWENDSGEVMVCTYLPAALNPGGCRTQLCRVGPSKNGAPSKRVLLLHTLVFVKWSPEA